MNASTPVDKWSALWIEWLKFKNSEEYANIWRWPNNIEGNLWCAFESGFRSAASGSPPTHSDVVTLRPDWKPDAWTNVERAGASPVLPPSEPQKGNAPDRTCHRWMHHFDDAEGLCRCGKALLPPTNGHKPFEDSEVDAALAVIDWWVKPRRTSATDLFDGTHSLNDDMLMLRDVIVRMSADTLDQPPPENTFKNPVAQALWGDKPAEKP